MRKFTLSFVIVISTILLLQGVSEARFVRADKQYREEKRKADMDVLQQKFNWWPTDAEPHAVKDDEKGGYWWWPTTPGEVTPWGNRGYVYVYKIIFDYKEDELPPAKKGEMRPSLLVRKVIKDVRVLFDYDKSVLREDAIEILNRAVATLGKNPEASILITGNTDKRGSQSYNEKLGNARAKTVQNFMIENRIAEDRIRIVSRGKLDALAKVGDLVGMQKDRNAHFVIAEVEEVMLPYQGLPKGANIQPIGEDKYMMEESISLESKVNVSTWEYRIKEGDSLSKIAKKELGSAHRWVYLYELNKDRVKKPNSLRVGQVILIPVE